MELPSVIRLSRFYNVPRPKVMVARKNILVRDHNTCQYCGKVFLPSKLTLDHVIPKSKGGLDSWENLVACCFPCNNRKDDKTPEEAGMLLLKIPMSASVHTHRHMIRSKGEGNEGWQKYLFF